MPINELDEIDRRVRVRGYCLLYSELFQDYVAFYTTPDVLERIPEKYVCYSSKELKEMFGGGKRPSAWTLRMIHEAKKAFGRAEVTSYEKKTDGQMSLNM